jgi:Asp-tRNA(Asn)/Glu-tRNA(Gln) amidotransferase A subunit family amidase
MYRRFQALFDEIDVLVCPTVAISPFPKEQPYPTEIEGGKVRSYIEWIAPTYGLTLMSNPILCLPCGVDSAGMPFGIQVCGRQGADVETLAIAQALESHMAAMPELARPIPDLEGLAATAA